MIEAPDEVRALAEDLNMHLPARPGDVRVVTEGYAIHLGGSPGPHGTVVQRLRIEASEVAEVVAEVRARLRAHGREVATWEVGPSARPTDLAARLRALGMRPAPEPVATAMVRSARLDVPTAADLDVRSVTTLGEFRSVQALFWSCFGLQPDAAAEAAVERDYEGFAADDHWLRFLAYAEGEPVAAADATVCGPALVLTGGATLPAARGRGAYRALLHARAAEAERRELQWLVTQAGEMSRPILQRLGFVAVARIEILVDDLGDRA